jgi:hypothetical protein
MTVNAESAFTNRVDVESNASSAHQKPFAKRFGFRVAKPKRFAARDTAGSVVHETSPTPFASEYPSAGQKSVSTKYAKWSQKLVKRLTNTKYARWSPRPRPSKSTTQPAKWSANNAPKLRITKSAKWCVKNERDKLTTQPAK